MTLFAVLANLASFVLEALELHPFGINSAMIFHGLYCLLIGYLAFKSTFLPRILGGW